MADRSEDGAGGDGEPLRFLEERQQQKHSCCVHLGSHCLSTCLDYSQSGKAHEDSRPHHCVHLPS